MQLDVKKLIEDILSQSTTMDDPVTIGMLLVALNNQGMTFAGDMYEKIDKICNGMPNCVVCKKLLEELDRLNRMDKLNK